MKIDAFEHFISNIRIHLISWTRTEEEKINGEIYTLPGKIRMAESMD